MRRAILAFVAGMLAASALPASADDAEVWHGAARLTGGKGYVTTPMGELHYRDVGPRDTATPFLLLHQTPWSMVEFAEIQNAIAAQGFRAITADTPGYGMSDAPRGPVSIESFADNLVPLLDALHVAKVVVGGHHTGASIAVAFAARHPERVAAVIIHGVPLYTAAERTERLASGSAYRMVKPDGSHLIDEYKGVVRRTGATPMVATWAVLVYFLQDKDIGHEAAFTYDLEPDLRKIAAPTLVLSDKGDTVHAMDLKAVKLRPDFAFRDFSEANLSLMNEPKRWADIAVEFAKAKASK